VTSREEPQLFSIADLASELVDQPPLLRDTDVRVVSRAPGGALTALASLEDGWTATAFVPSGCLDLLVLAGQLDLEGRHLASGSFATVPIGGIETHCRAVTASHVLFFWDPADPIASTSLYVASSWERPWETNTLPGVPTGLMRKRLREDDIGAPEGPERGWVRLIHVVPGWHSTDEERHVGCWEENILLDGDMHMTDRGEMRAGDCLANPPGLWHGPMASRGGALFVVHCDRPMNVEWRSRESPPDDIARYLRTEVWPWVDVMQVQPA
jgi:hypothetical protein